MAKLDVKVIDMQGGEITKVAYDGAEYFADGKFSGKTDVGNLLRFNGGGGRDVTVGAFYEVKFNRNDAIFDDANDNPYLPSHMDFTVFRKISANKPTLEERVEAIESDVAALKGEQVEAEEIEFKGAKYRKVDRYANEGDVVVFSATPKFTGQNSYITVGKAYKVSDGDGYDDAQFYADDNDHIRVYGGIVNRSKENVAVYEKVEAEYKPKLKAGDFVKFKRSISDTQAGKPYLIEYYTEEGKLAFKDDAGDWCDIARTGKYEILSAEEVAKHRESEKWAKLGRKKNEAKVGDIFRVTNSPCALPNGTLFKVTRVSGDIIDDDSPNNYSYMVGAHVELVAPVESLV